MNPTQLATADASTSEAVARHTHDLLELLSDAAPLLLTLSLGMETSLLREALRRPGLTSPDAEVFAASDPLMSTVLRARDVVAEIEQAERMRDAAMMRSRRASMPTGVL